MGTGCCFNRQALYGYDPVLTEEDLEPNIIVKSCCGSRKKKGSKKSYIDKKRAVKRTESTIPIFNMEDIEEGVEGALFLQCGERKFLSHKCWFYLGLYLIDCFRQLINLVKSIKQTKESSYNKLFVVLDISICKICCLIKSMTNFAKLDLFSNSREVIGMCPENILLC